MNQKIKLTYIIRRKIRWVAFEWIAKNINRAKFDLDFILIDETISPLSIYLETINIPYKIINRDKTDGFTMCIHEIAEHLKANKTEIVHAHFAASIPGLRAALKASVPVRIHTRHHSGCFDWKTNLSIEKNQEILKLSTTVIAINQKGKEQLIKEGVHAAKIAVVYHGFDLGAFEAVTIERIETLRTKYVAVNKNPIIGVVSRYIKVKGIEFTIDAFKAILTQKPDALLVLAGTFGKAAKEVRQRLAKLPKDSYIEIDFEPDLFALFRLFDVFVHVPIRPSAEAFGQVYIEAMLSGIPSVITPTGIAQEYARHQENAWVVDFQNSEQIEEGIIRLLTDNALREKIIDNAQKTAQQYSVERMMRQLETLYEERVQIFISH